ncbi:hypothetical protein, conserved [Eimeria maxima]|uniref:Uncharacterized protein n=1 Tax=Eimeria maxima TaxID=5804 RepID=U6M6J9_EIMMA|nr:hypothetical protein, conserved [Eimeria maxima]CDJ57305.1 hypothetical protein, conserved [Eimeria maxima]
MELGSAVSSVLVSPLAVDDVFRHRTVPEVQELLRQLQLQQANDVEELRSLIGVRYLSFLEGLPEITRMQQSAQEALSDAQAFGSALRHLADALGGAAPEGRQQNSTEPQQLRLQVELPLQNSTPLDDFLFSCEVDASTLPIYFPPHKDLRNEVASQHEVYSCLQEREGVLRGGCRSFRYLQQQLLLMPSRVWEAVRCQKFLEALRLICVDGTKNASFAMAAVRELQQQQRLKPAQPYLERQLSGCWALAQQTTRISPSLTVSLRALALRQLASPELPLPVVADVAAAATIIYLLENKPSVGEACEEAEKVVKDAAAKWLLGVFFSARVESLEAILAKRKKAGKISAVTSPAPACHERSNSNCSSNTIQAAVDAAEAMLVAFSTSLQAAHFLFSPLSANSRPLGASDISNVGAPASSEMANTFAATLAAEGAFCDVSDIDSLGISWALRALPGVFAVFAAQTCCSNGNNTAWDRYPCCCENKSALCPRARVAAFIEQWTSPLREQLSLLPAEDPRRNLGDIRFFWLRLMEKLKGRGTQWQFPTGPLFLVGKVPPDHSPISSTSSQEQDWTISDKTACHSTLALLGAVGESCINACIRVTERRVRALPLLSCNAIKDGISGTATSLQEKDNCYTRAFEKELWYHLVDIADLCGRAEDPQELRAALQLRAAIAASFLQSLAECTTPEKNQTPETIDRRYVATILWTSAAKLQKSWKCHGKAAATPAFDGVGSAIDISGGAMSFLLELSRHLTSVLRSLKVERISDSPILSFAIKAVASEAVAEFAAAAVAETKGPVQRQREGQHLLPSSQSHLLQLLVDIELLAEALDEPSPQQQVCGPDDAIGTLPQPLQRAIQAGLDGRRCAESLRNTAEEGRKLLQPDCEKLLQRRLDTGFAASKSLLWVLLNPGGSESGCIPSVASSTRCADNAFQLPLLEPRERLSLLPVAPLPAFESLLRSSTYEECVARAHTPAARNEKAEEEQQQAPKEAQKLHRLRLDDAVDSVSRGLQSWLKRGSSDSDGSGIFPSSGMESKSLQIYQQAKLPISSMAGPFPSA